MNFINILTETDQISINLDNVIAISPTETGTSIHTLVGKYETRASMDEVTKIIDTMQHQNHRIRIDGLKGETLNVKVVNK